MPSDLIRTIAGAVGFGIIAYLQRKNRPSSKKWLFPLSVSVTFLVLGIASLFGAKLTG